MRNLLIKIKLFYTSLSLSYKATFWVLSALIIQKVISFLSTALFTRTMTLEQYGEYTIYSSWLEVFTIFATLNLFYGAYNKGLVKFDDDKSTFSSSIQVLVILISLFTYSIFLFINQSITNLTGISLGLMTLIFIDIISLSFYRIWLVKRQFDYKYKSIFGATVFMAFFLPLVNLIAVLVFKEKGMARIVSQVVVHLSVYVILAIIILKEGKFKFKLHYWKYALSFNIPLIPHYLSSIILNQTDRVMIERMVGLKEAGIYGFAFSIGMISIFIMDSIANSINPVIYNALKENKFNKVKELTKIMFIFVALIIVGVLFITPEMVLILGTSEYREALWIIPPITISIFFRFIYSIYGSIEFYYEAKYFISIASLVNGVLNIILNYVFIQYYGYIAAAYVTLFCFILYATSHILFTNIILKKKGIVEPIISNRFVFAIASMVLLVTSVYVIISNYTVIRYGLLSIVLLLGITKRKSIQSVIVKLRKGDT